MPSLVEIDPVVLEKKIFKVFDIILIFLLLSPIGKGVTLHLNKLESPPPKNALCQAWLKLTKWFLRRRLKREKFTNRQTDRPVDGRQTKSVQKSSLELSAQLS